MIMINFLKTFDWTALLAALGLALDIFGVFTFFLEIEKTKKIQISFQTGILLFIGTVLLSIGLIFGINDESEQPGPSGEPTSTINIESQEPSLPDSASQSPTPTAGDSQNINDSEENESKTETTTEPPTSSKSPNISNPPTAPSIAPVIPTQNVLITVSKMTLDYETMSLNVGEERTLLATTLYSDGQVSHNATWVSSNPSVLSVDSNGKIVALAPGTAQIIAQTSVNGIATYATCDITVAEPVAAPTGYSIWLSTYHASIGERFRVYVEPNEDNVTRIVLHTISPSGEPDEFLLNEDGFYYIDEATGIWTIYASVSNEGGTYTASIDSDYVTIEITPRQSVAPDVEKLVEDMLDLFT